MEVERNYTKKVNSLVNLGRTIYLKNNSDKMFTAIKFPKMFGLSTSFLNDPKILSFLEQRGNFQDLITHFGCCSTVT